MNFNPPLKAILLATFVACILWSAPADSRAKDLSGGNPVGDIATATTAGYGSANGLVTPVSSSVFAFVPESGTWATVFGGLGVLVCFQRFRSSYRV